MKLCTGFAPRLLSLLTVLLGVASCGGVSPEEGDSAPADDGALSPTGTAEQAVAPSFPMVCRGGGPLSFEVYSAAIMYVRVSFNKSPFAASWVGSLNPGECTWLDRPINANEPAGLYHQPYGLTPLPVHTTCDVNTCSLRLDGISGTPYLPSTLTPTFRGDRTILDSAFYFKFNVFNDRGAFTVTSYLGKSRTLSGPYQVCSPTTPDGC